MKIMDEIVKTSAVSQYIVDSLRHGTDILRCSSARAAGKMKIYDAVELLIESLEDEDPDLRFDAAVALGQLGDKRAVTPLIQRLDDDDPEVIKCAIDSLAMLKDKESVTPLIEVLKRNKEFYFFDMDDNLQVNINAEIQEKAVEALGELGDAKAIKPLIEFIDGDQVYDIIEACLVALTKISDSEGLKKLDESLSDSDSLIRRRGVRALIKSGCPELSEKLTDLLIDEDNEVKLISMDALSKIAKDGRASVPLVLLLQDKNREVRLKAAETVGNIMGKKAVRHLIPLLGDNDSTSRARVVEILGNIESEEAVDPLLVLLQDEKDNTVIEEAVTSLGKIGGDEVLDYLIDFLSDKEGSAKDSLKKRLIYAIGSIKNETSLLTLIDILKNEDESESNKHIAVEMLNAFEGEYLPRQLQEAIEEEEERNRQVLEAMEADADKEEKKIEVSSDTAEMISVAEEPMAEADEGELITDFKVWTAMALRGNKSLVSKELLYSLLEADDQQVRKEAASSLALLGEEQALDVLISEKPTKESMVELGVLEAIANIDGPRADELLLAFLENQNGDIRYFTLKAIGSKNRNSAIFQKVSTFFQDNIDIVKQEAVTTLGNMKNRDAVAPLIELLFSSEAGDYLHDEIIRALHKIDNNQASDMILFGLSSCEDCVIQSRAIDVLGELNVTI